MNMRDRIDAVGGAVEVVSRRGHGTTVRGSVPVD
jgi:signal transduction histidine kinase